MKSESKVVNSYAGIDRLEHSGSELNYQPVSHKRSKRWAIRAAVVFLLAALVLFAIHIVETKWRDAVTYFYKWRCLHYSNPIGKISPNAALPPEWLGLRETSQMSIGHKQILYLGPLSNEHGLPRLVSIEFSVWPRPDGSVQGMPYHYEIWNPDFAGKRIGAGGDDMYDGLPAYLFVNPTYAAKDPLAANHLTLSQEWPNGYNELIDIWLTGDDKLLIEPRVVASNVRHNEELKSKAQSRPSG